MILATIMWALFVAFVVWAALPAKREEVTGMDWQLTLCSILRARARRMGRG